MLPGQHYKCVCEYTWPVCLKCMQNKAMKCLLVAQQVGKSRKHTETCLLRQLFIGIEFVRTYIQMFGFRLNLNLGGPQNTGAPPVRQGQHCAAQHVHGAMRLGRNEGLIRRPLP